MSTASQRLWGRAYRNVNAHMSLYIFCHASYETLRAVGVDFCVPHQLCGLGFRASHMLAVAIGVGLAVT